MKPPKSHKPGIYKILCQSTGKFYIGSSNNCYKRWASHWSALRANRHPNRYLQFAFNKYGKDAFEFIVLEEIDISELLIREQYYIDLSPRDNLLNCTFRASNSFLGKHHSEETKAIIAKHSKGENNPMYGKKHTKEALEKMSGEANHRSKFNWEIIREVRKQNIEGYTNREIANHLGLKTYNVYDIVKGKAWKE